ncbi:MAG: hypothetical protein NZO16_04430, partial [Deltaproteobacteria bacterium]|nr:hypothetical protein [Deltaproteobacteria bacterium]
MQSGFQKVSSVIAVTLILFSLIFTFTNYSVNSIVAELGLFNFFDLLMMPLLVLVNFFILSLVDYTALTSVVRAGVKYQTAFLSSFLANAFSYNLGAPLVVGAFFRYKVLSSYGISNKQILDT